MSLNIADTKIVIAGAGSIGCYVGGRLLQAGRNVHFLARDRIKQELTTHGLTLTDFENEAFEAKQESLNIFTSPDCLAGADIILVTVKSGATLDIAKDIERLAPETAVIVSLQNGVTNADKLRQAVGGRSVVAGMVPFNVVQMGEGRFHQGTSGAIVVEAGTPGLKALLTAPALEIEEADNMPAIMWGKLLLNLNNALNALSDMPLRQQIEDRAWRGLLADQMAETLSVLRAAGIKPKSALPLPPGLLPHLMRLPTPIFRVIAARMLDIDPLARSSMWEDLQRGRLTEIDELQGAVITLADQNRRSAPICTRISALIKDAEQAKAGSPGLSVETIRSGI
ncbi:MAG: 2-dehydropantoate 2-reductase [Henriciella sp.]|nr:2-dehydropantoate 2-reductase [Henriciella sp.]